MEILHHGGRFSVTGSCHELRLDGELSVLIDCGLLQGTDAPSANEQQLDFDTQQIKALLITHCHLDHVGRLPWLLAAGFRGPIYCTQATATLLPLVMEDAVKVGITRQEHIIDGLLSILRRLLRPVPYDSWQDVFEGLSVRFRQAGHIIGSAYIECQLASRRVVFSGDIGCKNTSLLPDPTPLEYADLLLLESTYGDRLHENRSERQTQLRMIIERCVSDRGAVLIPAFSIGRTQELLYELEAIIYDLKQRNSAAQFPLVVLDSPLAARFTEKYRDLKALWDAEAKQRLSDGRHPLAFDELHVIEHHSQHEQLVHRLQSTAEPVIIIAAGGMCAGGRITNYLKALLPDPRTDILFVGYQAAGTPGRAIQQYGPNGGYVEIDQQRITIKAQIHTLSGYSAHADQAGLLDFIGSAGGAVAAVRLTHGEAAAQRELRRKIRERFDIPVD
ncbi:MBL fold metallo-hydrolase [Pseudidiomarina sp.]|uniref:MBL fold metallo-hydrolase n=1 Tax=Pseudidiomarina sp. TaxID=2081707 RepID=UPI00299EA5D2|nr:MBL fold metallo-hydrolase [Pseudidiomarina sp.]MDX1705466.1 MBL fold metallo-hydrolase [Pseudidiomarina sp.]